MLDFKKLTYEEILEFAKELNPYGFYLKLRIRKKYKELNSKNVKNPNRIGKTK